MGGLCLNTFVSNRVSYLMSARFWIFRVALVGLSLCLSSNIQAHPGWGIAVDEGGDVYFTDVGNTTIWKWSEGEGLEALLTDTWAHSLGFDEKGRLFFGKEEYRGEVGPYCSFWLRDRQGALSAIIEPVLTRDRFFADKAALGANGALYYLSNQGLRKRTPDGVDRVIAPVSMSPMTTLVIGSEEAIYVSSKDTIWEISPAGEVSVVVDELVNPQPADPIFPDNSFNEVFGFCLTANDELLVANFGDRSVIRIRADEEQQTVYRAEAPWTPVGVTEHDGVIYVLESGWQEGVGHSGPRVRRRKAEGNWETVVVVASSN